VADLHPQLGVLDGSCHRQGMQCLDALAILDDDIARTLEIASVHLDIAREHQASSASGPSGIESLVRRGGIVGGIGQSFCQGRLGQAILEHDPTRQGQGLLQDIPRWRGFCICCLALVGHGMVSWF
jgi:hypothetical protein